MSGFLRRRRRALTAAMFLFLFLRGRVRLLFEGHNACMNTRRCVGTLAGVDKALTQTLARFPLPLKGQTESSPDSLYYQREATARTRVQGK